MNWRTRILLAALALLFGADALVAQDPAPRFGLQVGAGGVVPVADARGASGLGWDVAVAGDVEIPFGLAVRPGYLYGRFAAEEAEVRALSTSPAGSGTLRAKTQAHVGSLDIVWRRPWPNGRGSFYLFGGPVLSLRRVTIGSARTGTGPAFNESLVNVCEPLWLECAGGPVPYHRVLGIRRSVDLGLNVGAGVTFDVGLKARLFAEARYVHLDGPSFRDSYGVSRSPGAAYVPLIAGIRFQ